jgi:hypothetical protein
MDECSEYLLVMEIGVVDDKNRCGVVYAYVLYGPGGETGEGKGRKG